MEITTAARTEPRKPCMADTNKNRIMSVYGRVVMSVYRIKVGFARGTCMACRKVGLTSMPVRHHDVNEGKFRSKAAPSLFIQP